MCKVLFLCAMVGTCLGPTVSPSNGCCGTIIPEHADNNTSIEGNALTSSNTFGHEIRLFLDPVLSCSIETIEAHLTPSAGGPNLTSSNPVVLRFLHCSMKRGATFINKYTSFASDPTGYQYDVILTYKDINGVIIASYPASYALEI